VSVGWGASDIVATPACARARGNVASEVLDTLPRALAQAGVATMYLEVDRTDTDAQRLYQKAGFNADTQYMLMMRST